MAWPPITEKKKKEKKEKKGKIIEKATIQLNEEEVEVMKDREMKEKNGKAGETKEGFSGSLHDDEIIDTGLESRGNEENLIVRHEKGSVKRKGSKTSKSMAVSEEKPRSQKASQASSKKFKAMDIMPPNATKEVYASIFSSSSKSKIKETYMCRALPIGRN